MRSTGLAIFLALLFVAAPAIAIAATIHNTSTEKVSVNAATARGNIERFELDPKKTKKLPDGVTEVSVVLKDKSGAMICWGHSYSSPWAALYFHYHAESKTCTVTSSP